MSLITVIIVTVITSFTIPDIQYQTVQITEHRTILKSGAVPNSIFNEAKSVKNTAAGQTKAENSYIDHQKVNGKRLFFSWAWG